MLIHFGMALSRNNKTDTTTRRNKGMNDWNNKNHRDDENDIGSNNACVNCEGPTPPLRGPLCVQHNYTDRATQPIDIDTQEDLDTVDTPTGSTLLGQCTATSNNNKNNNTRKKNKRCFPVLLHDALDNIDKDGQGDIIGWQPHGRCFSIRWVQLFEEVIMPKYFNQAKLSSFQRQLNLYGFKRITQGVDRGSYYHEAFLRGKPDLARIIKRQRIKGTCVRGRANPDSEPNFYAMPFVGRDGRTVSGVTDMDVMATQGHTSEHNSENTVITPAKTRMASEGNFGLVSLWPEESARHEQGLADTRTQPMVCAGSPPDETPIEISPATAASLLSILDSDDWSMLMRPESPGYSTDNTNDDGDGDYNTAQEILQRCAHDTKCRNGPVD